MVATPELPPVSRSICTLKSWGLLSTATTYRVDVGAEPVTVAVTAWFCGVCAQGESALNVTCVDEKLMLTGGVEEPPPPLPPPPPPLPPPPLPPPHPESTA